VGGREEEKGKRKIWKKGKERKKRNRKIINK
jgi:hypothetical protein